MLIAHLADGTPVRVMQTPIPVGKRELAGRREGDILVGYTVPRYHPWKVLRTRQRRYMVRRGADGNLWLVHQRKGVEC